MGAHFALGLVENREPSALDALTLPLIGTSSHAEASIAEARARLALRLGVRQRGRAARAPRCRQRCARMLRIPQPGGEESLNVGAAAAICLYESARRRRWPVDTAGRLAPGRHSSLPIRRTASVITAASASQ